MRPAQRCIENKEKPESNLEKDVTPTSYKKS
jgi:hypothetical protein